MLINTAY